MEEEPERDHGRTEEPHEGDVSPFAEDADLNDISQSIAQRLGELEAAEDATQEDDRIVISDLPDDAARTGPETDAGDKKESHGDGSRKKKKKKKK